MPLTLRPIDFDGLYLCALREVATYSHILLLPYFSFVMFFVMLETRFPSQVDASSITFPVIEEDTRPGFLGRAVLHISWARPEGQCVHVYPHTC